MAFSHDCRAMPAQVVLGQGLIPSHHHPMADLMGDEELAPFLGSIRDGVERTVGQLPQHQDYVAQYCARPERARAAATA